MKTHTDYVQTTERPNSDSEVQEKKVVRSEEDNIDGVDKAANAVYAIVGILTGLIGLRFLLLILGANPQNGFSSFVYAITQPLVAPFYGLFGNPYTVEGVRFELESLVAIVVLAFFGWVIVKLLTISKPQ